MKTVKTYTSLSEAGFASSLLEAAGIPAFLADEGTYTAGYGAATGGIRLQVEETDIERALKVLETGPDGSVTPGSTPGAGDIPSASGQNQLPTGVFVVGAVMLVALAALIYKVDHDRRSGLRQTGNHHYSHDDNGDGRPDHFSTYRNGHLIKVEVDRNFDGRIDKWEDFDAGGQVVEMRLDENYDGQPDRWYGYEHGRAVSSRIDTDFNGIPDEFGIYKDSLLVQLDVRPNDSKIVTRRYFYKNDVCTEEWVDENGDGFFNYKIVHDPFGNLSERIPIHERQ